MPKEKKVRRKPPSAPYSAPAGFKGHYDTLAAAVVDMEAFNRRHGHQLAHYSSKYTATENRTKVPMERVPVTGEAECYISWRCAPGCPTNIHARRTRRSEAHLGPVVVTLNGPEQCAHSAAVASDGSDSADEEVEDLARPRAALDQDAGEAKADASDAEEDAGAAFEPELSDNEPADGNEAGAADTGTQEDQDQAGIEANTGDSEKEGEGDTGAGKEPRA